MIHNTRKMEVFRAGIARAVALLANQGVAVTQIGAEAFCEWDANGKCIRINIPMIPDNASSALLNAIQGYIDHEVGHALFTAPKQVKAALDKSGLGAKRLKVLGNIVEDVRIERAIVEKYAGSRSNLESLLDYVISTIWRPALMANAGKPSIATAGLVPYLRALGGQPQLVALCGETELASVYADLDAAMPDLPARLAKMRSTAEAYEIAAEIMKVIDTPPEEEDSGSGCAAGEGAGEGGSPSESEADVDQPDESSSGEDEESPTPGSSQKPKGSGSSIRDVDVDDLLDMDDLMAGEISDKIGREIGKVGIVNLTDQYDRILPYERIGRMDEKISFADLDRKVEPVVHPMAKTLQRLLVARSRNQLVGGYLSGRINGPSLHRYATGATDLFRRRVETQAKAVAISLLVDISGSMKSGGSEHRSTGPAAFGSKIAVAMEAAYAFAATLTRLKIPFEIIGFSTFEDPSSQMDELSKAGEKMAKSLGVATTRVRWMPVNMPIFKGFDETFSNKAKQRVASLLQHPTILKNNDDSTSIRRAGARLLVRPEPRKIMIVFSDGTPLCGLDGPSHYFQTKREVRALEEQGVEVFGVGIKSDAVRNFYSHYEVIHDIAHLPKFVIGKLRDMLLSKS